uniref:Kinesin motor domain-containing protein n=1 Tax=Peronospora matthiolae TaxID=2874970 RepID=A0AAV1UGA4_9STRA
MESGSEDEDNVLSLREELRAKTQALKQVQDEFDEYTQSSHELEQELEQELSRVEKRNVFLLNKSQYFERDLQLTRSKLDEALDQARKLEDELQTTRAELKRALETRCKLEQHQDDLETQVRVLQATESDLRHKMEREIEEKVFLLSDQDELQHEHEMAAERFRTEIMDLKSELYALQQKCEDVTMASEIRGSVSGNDSVATTHSQSEDGDEGYNSGFSENFQCRTTVQERDEMSREVLIESLREEIEALSSGLQDETEARAAAEAEVQQLRESLAHMEAMEAEMTDMTDELIGKSQEVRARDEQIEGMRESLLKLQSEMVMINDGGIEFTNERENLQNELKNKDKDISSLSDELETIKSQYDDLAENERQLQIRLVHESEAVDELKEQIETLTKRLEENNQERSELESKLQCGKGEMSQNRREVEDLNSTNVDLRKQLDESNERISELQRASALLTASTVSPAADMAESKRLRMEIQTMRTSMNSLSAENARLRSQEGMSTSVAPAKRVSADVLRVNYTPEQLARKYIAERTRNASLLSRLQTVCGNIQVFCRVRPIINEELEKAWGSKLAVNVVNQSDLAAMDVRYDRLLPSDSDGKVVSCVDMDALANNSSWKVFTFDRIMGPEETQNDVFREVEPIAQSVVDGFKACIFAYGQTGSGKTYTMEGTPSDPGLNYKIISHLFQSIQLRGAIHACEPDNKGPQDDEMNGLQTATEASVYHVQVGVLEIYNDSVRDLFNSTNKALDIRHDSATGDICVPDLTMTTVSSPQQTIDVLRTAQSNRVTGKTNSNMHSSRSHSIVIVQISKRRPERNEADQDPADFDADEEGCGKLYLVDLAGSERVKKSNVSGDMLREAAHINKSLSALADVMEALDKKMSHVPYRNSKLTYLLQDVLNSSCKTVMIVNVGPTIENASETFRSLQLAERVRNIVVGRNQIVKNKKDILSAKKAFAELQSLKQQMQISKRKYMQSQQSVVSLKRDQKNQSEKQSATLQSRLRAWETQNESLKSQNESLKRLVDDLNDQLKAERETKQKEAEQCEAAQRLLRQQSAKARVSLSQQETQQKLVQEREEEIKKLRQLLTEARRRSTSSLIPRLPLSSPPMKKSKSTRPTSLPCNEEGDDMTSATKAHAVSRGGGSRLQSSISSSNGTRRHQSPQRSKGSASARTTSTSKQGTWK